MHKFWVIRYMNTQESCFWIFSHDLEKALRARGIAATQWQTDFLLLEVSRNLGQARLKPFGF